MKLIKSSFKIEEQGNTIKDIYKYIEKCGRTCYKSESAITKNSAKLFVDKIINSGHGSVLEHGTIYLKAKNKIVGSREYDDCPLTKYENNKYSILTRDNAYSSYLYVTTNYRVLFENGWEDDLKYLCEPTKYHEKRASVRMTIPIGISREFNRHRTFSISEQSTRYCNYSKDKFNNELTFIIPYWVTTKCVEDNYTSIDWSKAMEYSEKMYLRLIQQGCKPQDAREVLPLSTATEVVYTAFISDWKHFFELRANKNAHPDAQKIAYPLKEEFEKLGYI